MGALKTAKICYEIWSSFSFRKHSNICLEIWARHIQIPTTQCHTVYHCRLMDHRNLLGMLSTNKRETMNSTCDSIGSRFMQWTEHTIFASRCVSSANHAFRNATIQCIILVTFFAIDYWHYNTAQTVPWLGRISGIAPSSDQTVGAIAKLIPYIWQFNGFHRIVEDERPHQFQEREIVIDVRNIV